MIGRLFRLALRWLPTTIPIGFLLVVAGVFYSQNHALYLPDGEFLLVSDEQLCEMYPRRVAEEDDLNSPLETTAQEFPRVPVAWKFLLTRGISVRLQLG